MGISEIINSLAMIFIMIIPGILLSKKDIINENQSKGISTIVVNITWPCLVISGMQIPFSKETLISCGYIFIIMIVAFALAFALSYVSVKLIKLKIEKAYLFTFMLVFANTGFIGIPVINAIYGKKAVFYASMVEMANDIFIFTIGIILIQLSAGEKAKINLKELISPGIFGIIIGFCLFLFNYKLPGFLGESVNMIGSATTPLTMLVIGLQLGQINIKELLGDLNLYLLSFLKLIIIPGVVFLLMRFALNDISLLAKVIIIEFAMPVATCTSIFSQQYNSDVPFATKGILLSTVFSIITIPIFAILLELN
ncbi:AEC family transporter [Anaerovorax odorimutans]|uniref:AEC family transporter n=1 Tax=Anaerovorax odorimutans TaxID=109327 RepID=UPI0004299C46|nr:AEC family transporter [Anaerovorax odorimutans]